MSKYLDKHIEFLRKGYASMRAPELTRAFNKTFRTNCSEIAIKSVLRKHDIKCGRKTGNTTGAYRLLTPEQAQFVKDFYPLLDRNKLTKELNSKFGTDITVLQLVYFVNNHHMRSGRTGGFEVGSIPMNKGTKGLTGKNRTTFRPGNVPVNLKSVGSERTDKYGYIHIKIAERNPYTGSSTRYKPKHVVVWESFFGPVPKGKVVIFSDCDKKNFNISNLRLVSRAELLRLNRLGYSKAPRELKQSIFGLAKLTTRTFDMMNDKNNKQLKGEE